MAQSNVSREQIEVYRFSLPVTIGLPLVAIFLQTFLGLRFRFFTLFDLPLLVTLFFAVGRRSPVTGLITGGIIGLVQDSLTHQPLGLYGIAKTVVGFGASSLGVKIDVDNPGTRLLVTFFFYLVHQLAYLTVARGLVGQDLVWRWGHEFLSGLANGILAVGLFAIFDRFKQKN